MAGLLRDQRVSLALLPPPVASLLAGEADSFVDLRVLIVGGEACTSELVRAWVRPGRRFYNGYGPTEATVAVTVAQCRGDEPVPPIGRPMPNQQVYVLDRHLNPVPVGVAGQLYLGGVGLARGYLNRPELTADRFIPHPFVTDADARLYATGDLVRYLPDGNLVFLGRLDDQIKIRGFRVELGEIEAALRSCPGVLQAVVVARDDLGEQRRLVGYVTADPGWAGSLSPAELRRDLAERLPGYLVPAHVVALTALPLTPAGKLDRAALPVPVMGGSEPGAGEGLTPRTIVESLIADLFAEILGLDQVRVGDGFFDLGGNSLQAMQFLSRLRDTFDIEAGVTDIFQAPTVTTLAELFQS
ncbi:MAG: non-ribosomal peptide synthetase, partial [Actinomycetes bacterium]